MSEKKELAWDIFSKFLSMRAIKKLLEIIAYLRSKDGCAWDKKQTPESLLPHLEEETWEVMDAVKKNFTKKN